MGSNPRRGLSLIEVVASIVLLSVLMVSVISAFTQHKQQIERSNEKLMAAELLDEQLARWLGQGDGVPFPASGRFGQSEFVWQTFRAAQSSPMPGGLLAVTVEVSGLDGKQLLSVDVASSGHSQQNAAE